MKRNIMILFTLVLILITIGYLNYQDEKINESNNSSIIETDAKKTSESNLINSQKQITEIDFSEYGLNAYGNDLQVTQDGKFAVLSGSNYNQELSKVMFISFEENQVIEIDSGRFMDVYSISPDGKYIIYGKYNEIGPEMYLYLKEDDKSILISENAFNGSFSPDITKIAYAVKDEGIFVYNIESNTNEKIVSEEEPWYPIWYPDNENLFYFQDLGVKLGDGAGNLQGLGKVSIKTKEAKQLFKEETGKYRSAEWIIPGKVIHIFAGWDDAFYNYILDLETGKKVDLGENYTFLQGRNTTVNESNFSLYRSTGELIEIYSPMELTTLSLPDEGKPYISQSFSSNGTKFAFIGGDFDYHGNIHNRYIWIANTDGTGAKLLTKESGEYVEVFWINNDTKILAVDHFTGDKFMLKIFDVN